VCVLAVASCDRAAEDPQAQFAADLAAIEEVNAKKAWRMIRIPLLQCNVSRKAQLAGHSGPADSP
jgi:hypothetical protein